MRLLEGAAMLGDVAIKVGAEVFEAALQRIGGARGEGAEGAPGAPEAGQELEFFEIARASLAGLEGAQQAVGPAQAAPTGSTPAAGLLGEEMDQVQQHPDRTGAVVKDDHGAGAHAAAGFLYLGEVHPD